MMGHLAHTREMRIAYVILVKNPKQTISLGRHARKWRKNITMDLK